jgi:ATP-binding cassette, subfamily B, multidrug efflux pump
LDSPTVRADPDRPPERRPSLRKVYARLWPHLLVEKSRLLRGLGCIIVFAATSLLGVRLLGAAVDEIEKEGAADLARITWLALGFMLVVAVSGVFGFLRRYLMIGASRSIEVAMRDEVYGHLLRQSHGFFDHAATGDLMSRLTADVEGVRQAYGPGIMYISDTIFRAPATLALMLMIDVRLSLLALTPLVVLTVVVKLISPAIHRYSRRVQEGESELRARAQESFSGVRVVKTYGQEENEIRDYAVVANDYLAASMGLARARAFLRPSIMALAGLGPILVLYVGGQDVMRGELGYGGFIEFTMFYAMLVWPMMAIGWVLTIFQRGAAAMARVNEILDRDPEIVDVASPRDVRSLRGEIEFRDMTFSYDGATPALQNIDLHIQPGQTVAIVGPTGSGKSTLVSLVPRLFDASPGSLLIDGMPVNEIPATTLRRSIAAVPQETFLFSATIRSNIAYGLTREVSEEEIREAATISRIADDIDGFPDGFRTLLGERGVNLSGGQKQRIALARAIILGSPILILDDALSSVDTQTEERILGGLQGVMAGRTTLIISHRVSTVKKADLIVVLDGGRIVERGIHDDLITQGGLYAKMHRMQLLEEELEALE